MGKNKKKLQFLISLRFALILGTLLLASFPAKAQLSQFGLSVATTDETCEGNGTMAFTVTNLTANATMLFSVYLLPNLTTPVTSGPSLNVSGLVSGTYSVSAVQTLGTLSNTITPIEVIIDDNTEPLVYDIEVISHNCAGAEIVVNVISGTATLYELSAGPVTMPPQVSPNFTDLPNGQYNIRVYDACGNSPVTTHVVDNNPAPVAISDPIYSTTTPGDCNNVTVTNTVSYPEGTVITYPITIQYTIHPSGGGAPITEIQTYNTGLPAYLEFSNEFPVNNADPYTYDLTFTNGCGNTYSLNGTVVSPTPTISASKVPLPCGLYYLNLNVSQYTAPYTLSFNNPPVGFNPQDFNSGYPGPYNNPIVSFGGEGNPVPEGIYDVTITDACGRTANTTLEIEIEIPEPVVSAGNNGCFASMGRFTITIPDREIVFAEVVDAPPAYIALFPLPNNVSAFITASGKLTVTNIPVGNYFVNLTDECGQVYLNVPVEIPDFVERDFAATAMTDCNQGMGAVRVSSGNGKLVQVSITEAPAAYNETLPLDVSNYIDSSGFLFLDNLPEGTYTFHGTDACGVQRTVSVTITGYQPANTLTYTLDANCNSFNIIMADNGSSGGNPTYWMQMLLPGTTNQWVHPATQVPYVEGTMPDASTGIALINNQANNNFQFFGTFRIVKAFQSVGQGTSTKVCFESLDDVFEYQYEVTIDNVYNLECRGTPGDVLIDASGIGPLLYRITAKDGAPFFIDNGTNNIFSGLDPGVYVFEVENACGEVGTTTKNISLLPDLVEVTVPDDMLICRENSESAYQPFDLTVQDAVILGNQSLNSYTVTYHLSQDDADNSVGALTMPYVNVSNPQTIYARVVHNNITICDKTVSFNIEVAPNPVLHVDESSFICEGQGWVVISADEGYDAYHWSTGETTASITVYNPGTYSVEVTRDYTTGPCTSSAEVVVTESGPPHNISAITSDWTEEHNTITVITDTSGDYEYSLDNDDYQDSPVFTGLEPGVYTVYVKDVGGCGQDDIEVVLLNYPKFFTPNGDGQNETWRIPNSWFEPGMLLRVYDRYGKLIKSFDSRDTGWDGTLNGKQLPSTDYWFIVERQDGRVFKGHFAMIR